MKSLPTRLKEFCEFQMTMGEASNIRDFVVHGIINKQLKEIFEGGRYENARLKPVLDCLIECVDKIEDSIEANSKRQEWTANNILLEALSNLERLLNEMEKK